MHALTTSAEELRRELSDRDVAHVWRLRLGDGDSAREAALAQVLSTDERRRASAFLRDAPRQTYVESRACLRHLLGAYLQQPPAEIRIDANEFGKPRLSASDDAWLSFNVAHSVGYTLVILARERRVGVDVERVREDLDHDSLARSYFTREERAALEQLEEPARREGFFACWTRKEAYIKATGRGLSTPLDSFRVSVSPAEPAALVWVDGDVTETARWSLHDVPVAPGYAAAAAVEGSSTELRLLDYVAALPA